MNFARSKKMRGVGREWLKNELTSEENANGLPPKSRLIRIRPEKYQFVLIACFFPSIFLKLLYNLNIPFGASLLLPLQYTMILYLYLYLLVARILDFSMVLFLLVVGAHFLPLVVRQLCDIPRSVVHWWIWFMSCQMST